MLQQTATGRGRTIYTKAWGGQATAAVVDKPKAVTAAAHKLAPLVYIMLTRGEEYTDQGQQYFEERYRERVVRQLTKETHELGVEIVSIAHTAQQA